MANAFTASKAFRFGGPVGKTMLRLYGSLVIDTTASGGAVDDDLPATTFGLREIVGCASIVISDNSKAYIGVPSADGDSLLVSGGASNAPMDLPNGTYKVWIEGYA